MSGPGYAKLLAAVERDEETSPGVHDYRGKLAWVTSRAEHYARIAGLRPTDVLDAWERDRDYWYMNYYQDCNQPEIEGDAVRVFDTPEDARLAVGASGFRCPACGGVSKSPYECDTGLDMHPGETCDWKSYGLFRTLGKGVHVFVKSEMKIQEIFMPIEWEPK
jgi:hypothetical protein